MKRKLIKQGLGGVTISLPIKWVRKKRLKPGDEINLEEHEGNLVITGAGHAGKIKRITFNKATRPLLRTYLSSYYRLGYSELHLKFKEEQPFPVIQEIVSSLMGYEILSQDKTSCVIKDIMGNQHETGEHLINRLFQSVFLLQDTVLEHLKSGTKSSELKPLRYNIMKLRDYCQRVIVMEGKEKAHELYTLVVALEKIAGDHYYILESEPKPSESLIEFLTEHDELLRDIHKCFLKKDFDLANSTYRQVRKHAYLDFKESKYIRLFHEGNSQHHAALFCSRILQHLLTLASRIQVISD